MTTDSPRHIQINLDIVTGRFTLGRAILLCQPLRLYNPCLGKPAHQQIPHGAPPTIGDALVCAFAELWLFSGPDAPGPDVLALVSGVGLEHSGPFGYTGGFFDWNGGSGEVVERDGGSRGGRGSCLCARQAFEEGSGGEED